MNRCGRSVTKYSTDHSALKWKKAASHAMTRTDTEDTNYAEGNEPAWQAVVAGPVWCGSAHRWCLEPDKLRAPRIAVVPGG